MYPNNSTEPCKKKKTAPNPIKTQTRVYPDCTRITEKQANYFSKSELRESRTKAGSKRSKKAQQNGDLYCRTKHCYRIPAEKTWKGESLVTSSMATSQLKLWDFFSCCPTPEQNLACSLAKSSAMRSATDRPAGTYLYSKLQVSLYQCGPRRKH